MHIYMQIDNSAVACVFSHVKKNFKIFHCIDRDNFPGNASYTHIHTCIYAVITP